MLKRITKIILWFLSISSIFILGIAYSHFTSVFLHEYGQGFWYALGSSFYQLSLTQSIILCIGTISFITVLILSHRGIKHGQTK